MILDIILFISFVLGFAGCIYLIKRHIELNEKLEGTFEYVNGFEYVVTIVLGTFGCAIMGPCVVATGYLLVMELIG